MTSLEAELTKAQESLRKTLVWPLPSELPALQTPPAAWKSWDLLTAKQLPMRAKGDYRALISVLNQLNHIRHVANVTGSYDVADNITKAVEPFEHGDRVAAAAAREELRRKSMQEGTGVDELGRVYAIGRRKSSSARIWMVPTAQARELFETPAPAAPSEDEVAEVEAKAVHIPEGEIVVNHLPITRHFSRVTDREVVTRPLRVTGLIGAYNIFALTRGGGPTGQAGAISLAIARALAKVRNDAVPALINDNALHRDGRSVERKKTNRVKARKAVSTNLAGSPGRTLSGILEGVVLVALFLSQSTCPISVAAPKMTGHTLTITAHLGQALNSPLCSSSTTRMQLMIPERECRTPPATFFT